MENLVDLLKGLGQNFALALAFIYLANFSRTFLRRHLHPILNQLVIGLFFGLVALLGMLSPIQIGPGRMLDGRIALTGLSAIVGGGISGFVTAGIVASYRYMLGGAGRWIGVAGILTAATLGLAICHDIIIQHRGTIELDSEPGEGACFVITLPAVP